LRLRYRCPAPRHDRLKYYPKARKGAREKKAAKERNAQAQVLDIKRLRVSAPLAAQKSHKEREMQGQTYGFQQLRVPFTLSLADLDGLSMFLNLHPTISPSRLPAHRKRMRESTPSLAARQQTREMAGPRPSADDRLPGDPTFDKPAANRHQT
jgi:hypothetical protein